MAESMFPPEFCGFMDCVGMPPYTGPKFAAYYIGKDGTGVFGCDVSTKEAAEKFAVSMSENHGTKARVVQVLSEYAPSTKRIDFDSREE